MASRPSPATRRAVLAALTTVLAIGTVVWIVLFVSDSGPAPARVDNALDLPPAGQTLRVAHYNIRRGKGIDGVRDLDRIVDDLRALDADIICLNEVGYAAGQLTILAEALSMTAIPAPVSETWGGRGGPRFGNAILTRVRLDSTVTLPLPPGDRGRRNVTLARVPTAGGTVNLLATHTAVRDSDAQLEAVLTLFESLTAPAVLAADLNARRDHPRLARTLGTADDALAPADAAGDRIDWILVRGAPTSDAFVGLIHASDHPPVAVTIENPAQ